MSTTKLDELLQALKQPFHPSAVYWKPGRVSKEGTKALALPYATLRAYQNRLDDVCGLDWSVTYVAWGKRIICNLTIGSVMRSSTGEPDSQAERSEIAGTAAEAQAFKRACSMFSLGRYLYHLPTVWVEYDAQARQFTAQAKAKLTGIVALHYQRAMPSEAEAVASPQPEDAEAAPKGETPADAAVPAALRKQFHRLGRELYGDRWAEVRQRNVERITDGQHTSTTDLTVAQMQKLIEGMQQLKRTRKAAAESKEREQ
jgi:hypothetical protein